MYHLYWLLLWDCVNNWLLYWITRLLLVHWILSIWLSLHHWLSHHDRLSNRNVAVLHKWLSIVHLISFINKYNWFLKFLVNHNFKWLLIKSHLLTTPFTRQNFNSLCLSKCTSCFFFTVYYVPIADTTIPLSAVNPSMASYVTFRSPTVSSPSILIRRSIWFSLSNVQVPSRSSGATNSLCLNSSLYWLLPYVQPNAMTSEVSIE